MKKILFLVFSICVFAKAALASTEFGNGGNAIVCENNLVRNQFYDIYESATRYGLEPKFPDFKLCRQSEHCIEESLQLADLLLSRLEKVDPDFYKELSGYLVTFQQESRFVLGKLLPVDDSGLAFVPLGCRLEQFAIQHEPISVDDRRYFISREIWLKVDMSDKAALIVHELLLRSAVAKMKKVSSSEGVRYMNALILSGKIMTMEVEAYRAVKNKYFGNPE